MHFIKMHGIGNDYIYVDEFLYKAPADIGDAARLTSDRHTGIGGDGLILIQPSQIADCKMRMFNADGSEGRMCGNAIRCIARYMLERHPEICPGDTVRIETLSGIKIVTAQRDAEGKPSMLRADMGAPGLSPESIPVLTATPQDRSKFPAFQGAACAYRWAVLTSCSSSTATRRSWISPTSVRQLRVILSFLSV